MCYPPKLVKNYLRRYVSTHVVFIMTQYVAKCHLYYGEQATNSSTTTNTQQLTITIK